MRQKYSTRGLSREDLDPNPIVQFENWFKLACEVEPLANAMSLATTGSDLKPAVRTVLLKLFDANGFVFFTNFESRKARQIAENPNVAVVFHWYALERQLVISGIAKKIPTNESLGYFLTRPRGSQLGAWVSQQSSVLSSRRLMEMKMAELKQKFAGGKIPLPDFWGGYRIEPETYEFWQGCPDRLHDRFEYTRNEDGSWLIERLAP